MADFIQLAAGLALHAWLAAMVLWRRFFNRFPWFVVYCLYAIAATAIRLATVLHPRVYFYAYWFTDPGFSVLGIAALHEAFRREFAGFYLLRWFRWIYYGGIAVVVGIAVANSLLNPPLRVYPLFGLFLDLGIAVNCIQAAIFALFYVFAKLLDVPFRRYTFGVVLGFGISSLGTVVPFVTRSTFGTKFESAVRYVPSVAYFGALMVWLSAFWSKEAARDQQAPPMSAEQMTETVTQYLKLMRTFFGRHDAL